MKKIAGKIIALMLATVMMTGTVTVFAEDLNLSAGPDPDSIMVETQNSSFADEGSFVLESDDVEDTSSDLTVNSDVAGLSEGSECEDALGVVATSIYSVKFNGNGAKCGKMGPMYRCEVGKSYKLPFNKFSKYGYTFNGWNTQKNGKGKSYKNRASIKDLTKKNNDTVTLYAQWKKAKKKGDFELQSIDTGRGVIVIAKNNTKKHWHIVTNVTYYSGNRLITSGQPQCPLLESKGTCAMKYGYMSGYDGYTVKVQYKEQMKGTCYARKAKSSYKLNKKKKKVTIKLTKLNKNIYNGQVAVVFYKGNKALDCVQVSPQHGWAGPFENKTKYTLTVDYPKIDDKFIEPDKCKVYMNSAWSAKY